MQDFASPFFRNGQRVVGRPGIDNDDFNFRLRKLLRANPLQQLPQISPLVQSANDDRTVTHNEFLSTNSRMIHWHPQQIPYSAMAGIVQRNSKFQKVVPIDPSDRLTET